MNRGVWRHAAKRVLDFVVAAGLLIAISPLLVGVWLLVRWRMGSPAIFCQPRPGRYGRPFSLYKFRSMTDARGPDGSFLPDPQRLTSLGRFLRRTSLDELPQLWNVLRGDLSLVGPRPLLMEYLDRYTPEQAHRMDVKPGITGWAQIHGRNAISWEEKFELDLWYIRHWSIWLDCCILVATLARVVWREGIDTPLETPMPTFLGSVPTRKDAP